MSPYKELPLASQVDPEDSNEKDSITWEDPCPRGKFARLRSHAVSWLPWALHLLLLGLYITLYVRTEISFGKDIGSPVLYNGVVPIEHTLVDFLEPSLYAGRPNDKKEVLWDDLLSVGFVSITEDERSGLLHESAPDFRHPGNFVVELDVFHQLHCLRALRKQLWHPVHIDILNDPETVWEAHLDHCIDFLRHSLMCQSALTPTTFYWDDEKHGYHPTESMPHRCVNFDKVWDWAASRNTTGEGVEFVGALPDEK